MQIVVDENIPNLTIHELRSLGHAVTDIRRTDRQGSRDTDLWTLATDARALLITTDKGFVRYRDEHHHGVLIIRLRQPNLARIHGRIIQAMKMTPELDWSRTIVIMRDRSRTVIRGRQ